MTTLSERLWASIQPLFGRILEHPFIVGLTDGRLDIEAFRFYVVQDALYLQEYARALAVCAAKAPHPEDIRMFAEHASGALAVETQLHESFIEELGLTDEDLHTTPMAPTNLAYTSYLLASVYRGSFAEALGAVLPCYWIYWEVGKALIKQGSPNALYQRWIDTYGGAEFAAIVEAVLRLTDQVGRALALEEEALVAERFTTAARYEWMFWDMGFHKEGWPI